jgi:hypothetical protein
VDYREWSIGFIDQVRELDGPIVEMGVAEGFLTIPMARHLKATGSKKKILAFDTFAGFPYDGLPEESALRKGGWCHPLEKIQTLIAAEDLGDIIVPVVGMIQDTLPTMPADLKFSYVWVDMDLWESTVCACRYLNDHVLSGGVVGFHDWEHPHCPLVRKAIEETLDYSKFELIFTAPLSVFFRRKPA